MPRVFVRFLEEIEDSKEAFRNYLTFRKPESWIKLKKFHLNVKSVNNLIAQSCTYLCGDTQKERCAGI